MPEQSAAQSRNILGVAVTGFNWDEALDFFDRTLKEGQFQRVAWLNAHCANVAHADATYKQALQSFLVLPDGVGVDIASKIAYGQKFPANLNGTDFVPRLLGHIKRPLRIGLIGGRPGIPEQAAEAFRARAPQHDYQVFADGFFASKETPAILDRLAEYRPDIVLVAMGVPLQELFIRTHITATHCTMACAVGALFDFQAGATERAPQWIRDMRLEWAYRLMREPGRLAGRYLVGNPLFLWRVVQHAVSRYFRQDRR